MVTNIKNSLCKHAPKETTTTPSTKTNKYTNNNIITILQETLETQEQWELFTNKDGLAGTTYIVVYICVHSKYFLHFVFQW